MAQAASVNVMQPLIDKYAVGSTVLFKIYCYGDNVSRKVVLPLLQGAKFAFVQVLEINQSTCANFSSTLVTRENIFRRT